MSKEYATKVIAPRRNTTVKQDLRDIGRMLTGGRGGRQRRQAIDDKVDEAVTGKRR